MHDVIVCEYSCPQVSPCVSESEFNEDVDVEVDSDSELPSSFVGSSTEVSVYKATCSSVSSPCSSVLTSSPVFAPFLPPLIFLPPLMERITELGSLFRAVCLCVCVFRM